MVGSIPPEGWEWYPLQVQLWIVGVAFLVALALMLILWWRWRRPLERLRSTIDETEAYRELEFQRGRQYLEDISAQAQRELLDVVTMARRQALDEELGHYLGGSRARQRRSSIRRSDS